MGLLLDQAFAQAKELGKNATIRVAVATNQGNGIVSYATGTLVYKPLTIGRLNKPVISERFSTRKPLELSASFSDRTFQLGNIPPDKFDLRDSHPFSPHAKDAWGLTLLGGPSSVATFQLRNWGNASFDVRLSAMAGLMVGEGSPIGNGARQALYLLAITSIHPPDKLR